MNTVKIILEKLANTTSNKVKVSILTEHAGNDRLKNVFKFAYDRVTYTYGVSVKTVLEYPDPEPVSDMFTLLEDLANRKVTGHKALALCKGFIESKPDDADLFLKIINRDLRVNVSEKTLNKIWKGIVPKPKYCRCDVLGEKSKMSYPAYVQLKCDGTYRECYVQGGEVRFLTRSGETYINPVMAKIMSVLPDGYYIGEFTIGDAKHSANRSEGNGLINSDNPPYEDIHFTVWDNLTVEEYNGKVKTPYVERLKRLSVIQGIDERLDIVPTVVVNNVQEALKTVSEWMKQGLEGGVLKDFKMVFKDGTSKQQLKIKLKVDADVRITGYTQGTGKRANYIGAITFSTDDGKIKGQCSGFTDAQMADITANKDQYLGKIMAVQFNDLSKAEGNDYYALMHPRMLEIRNDKTETDTLERVMQLRNMARALS